MEGLLKKIARTNFKKLWQRYRFSVIMLFAVQVLVFFAYHFVSDGDFSFLMTLGSMLSVVSFGLLVLKSVLNKNVTAISMKTLQCYLLVFVGRLSSILIYEGYLPFDKSGDWFYQTCEVITLLMVIFLLIAGYVLAPTSYNADKDAFRWPTTLSNHMGALTLIVPTFVLAVIFHPSLNNNIITDTAWTFALYLEAVAILPQIFMFMKQQKDARGAEEVETYTSNFAFGIAASRMLSFVFWLSSYHELNDKYAEAFHRKYPGAMVVISQVVNLVLLADYVYLYLSAARQGEAILVRTI